jgi:hypothetical protein
VGKILECLGDPTAPNNGAALVEITQKFGLTIKAYIDNCDLRKAGTS